MTETEAREIAAPDSWPWPMSQEAQRWVGQTQGRLIKTEVFQASGVYTPTLNPEAVTVVVIGSMEKPHEPEFNRSEHERFMKGLK